MMPKVEDILATYLSPEAASSNPIIAHQTLWCYISFGGQNVYGCRSGLGMPAHHGCPSIHITGVYEAKIRKLRDVIVIVAHLCAFLFAAAHRSSILIHSLLCPFKPLTLSHQTNMSKL